MENEEQYLSSKPLAGPMSLARVFWGYGVVGFFIVGVLGNWYIGTMQKKNSAIAIALAVAFLYSVVWMVASWRSSGNYNGLSLWRFLTRVVVVVIGAYWIFLAVKIAPYISR